MLIKFPSVFRFICCTYCFRIIFILICTGSMYACANPKLTHGGEKARILSSVEVANCQSRGSTTVSTRESILGIRRQDSVIEKELETLARNSAVNMGGDTVSAISVVEDGEQSFAVYRCIP